MTIMFFARSIGIFAKMVGASVLAVFVVSILASGFAGIDAIAQSLGTFAAYVLIFTLIRASYPRALQAGRAALFLGRWWAWVCVLWWAR